MNKYNDMNMPLYNVEDDEADELVIQKDYDYVKSMYPKMARDISGYVDEECDKMEYEGSPMFSEYPDKSTMMVMAQNIYSNGDWNRRRGDGCRDRDCRDGHKRPVPPPYVPDRPEDMDNPILSLIEVMLCNEINCRRNRFKRRMRRFR